ncbi:YdcF family protein [Pseudoduganella sp. RAF53_2]|uniref:YdcF family protein n=1 Tax=unclassified Pseudoduganella TaxID=2637179 RepID=UPI003F9CC400
MNKRITLAAALAFALPLHAAPVANQHWSLLANRLFPMLSGAAQPPAGLTPLLDGRKKRMNACEQAPKCLLLAAAWSEAEMDAVAAASPGRQGMADDGATAQVKRELRGLNTILQVYGFGNQPRYPTIDGPVEKPGTAEFKALVADAISLADAGKNDPAVSLDPSLALAIALIDVSERHEAVDFEPLDQTHNTAALARARSIDWKRYKYTAAIIPGVGPENPLIPLSARGKQHIQLAASRFANGDVAFIIVSGASVHPRGSRYVEAVEMRKALIERFHIPADRIVIEPYARHTTTNLRNATRRLAALGAPASQPALIIANVEQSRYIESAEFAARNQAELGYEPGTIGLRHSPFELEFHPSLRSMRVDPMDPLDP